MFYIGGFEVPQVDLIQGEAPVPGAGISFLMQLQDDVLNGVRGHF